MNPILSSIREKETPYGSASMWWLGQMGLLIKMGTTLLSIDYYASPLETRRTPPPIPMDELTDVDLILGTHDHLDHMDHDSWKCWAQINPKATFIFPRAHGKAVLADGVVKGNAKGMNDGETLQVGDITIHAIAAAHEFLDQDPQTGLYPCLQYIIEGNGVRIHHAGDTLRYEGMLGKVTSFGPIDAQLLPINGRDAERYARNCIGNMTYQEAADFAAESGSRLILPGHWDMFADNSADPRAFASYLSVKYQGKVKCKIPHIMEEIPVTARS
ncbi:MAG: MBL fold metallo-hydrolase [Lachnospiraceae bacterium]|nr:MBL fold metallo-hydrolase [Lachnospiraceae bacterium]